MIYFDYGSSDEPDERASSFQRIARKMTEAAVLAQLEDAPGCHCKHPFAVLSLTEHPSEFLCTFEGVKTACCVERRINLECTIDTSRIHFPQAKFIA